MLSIEQRHSVSVGSFISCRCNDVALKDADQTRQDSDKSVDDTADQVERKKAIVEERDEDP